tara:strand:+ start:2022 stop:4043 length:2022 start_codon:yes stop_codon:yes gene_type:complete
MSFLVSPGVHVKEIDLTNVVPSVATSIGAICGPFARGPVSEVTSIGSEEELVKVFGKPNGSNFEWWFAASNFLQYANDLKVVRAESAVVNAVASGSAILIRDTDHYQASFAAGEASVGEWAARTAGTHGNGIGISVCPSGQAFEQGLSSNNRVNDNSTAIGDTTIVVDDVDASGFAIGVGDLISFSSADNATITNHTDLAGHEGIEYEVTAINTGSNVVTFKKKDDPNGAGLAAVVADDSYIRRRWRFYDLFDGAPGTSAWATDNGRGTGDELHVAVYDTTGDITGYDVDTNGNRTNGVMETFANLSKNPVAKTAQGGGNYYPDVIYRMSEYVYWMDHNSGGTNWGTDTTSAYTSVVVPTASTLASGTDDYAVTAGELNLGYDKFSDTESLDINLVIGGPSSGVGDTASDMDTHVTMLTDLVEKRKDCVAFASPYRAATVNVVSNITQADNVIEAFDLCPSSSYVVYDSGYKYMYDKYNDVYRFVPMNGDTAGLCANADKVADPWFSPAGYNRGGVRGAIKLSFNPTQTERDRLYRARINPVVNFPGQGVVLFGDKTALSKPSAFDRINVRRLFLVLEKAIATAAKYQLFEFNDEFTRAQFRNLVEPFLRDVQGRRGIFDFKVVCDGTNNTGEVIDRNEFIGDIYIKPARSINFITLNFIAVRTGVAFSEVGG